MMSIRLRLVCSYVAMIVVPVLLMLLSIIFLALFFMGDLIKIKDYYRVAFVETEIEQYVDQRVLLYNELNHNAILNPDRLLDASYLSNREPTLERMRVAIAVELDGQLFYRSPGLDKNALIAADDGRYVSADGRAFQFTKQPMTFADRSTGMLYVFTDLTPLYRLADRIPPALLASLLLAFLLPGGLLTFFVSRSILRPLRELQVAAERMKDGHLDFTLPTHRKDELGLLSRAFEEMRIRLKQSIDLRLKDEENRKELISNISHDLKTPITAIKGYVEGILDGVANDPAKVNKYLQTIRSKSLLLESRIDELFLYSKLDLRRIPFEFESVLLLPFLQDCAEECALDMEKQGVALHWDPTGVPEYTAVRADRAQLKRALLNMLENSKKFMDKQPASIQVRAELTPNGRVAVMIEDNGIGIDKESLPYIFDRFYRADKARTSSAYGGSGLGLAIAKQIVVAHGGTIEADSRLGAGTTMTVTLPAHQPERS